MKKKRFALVGTGARALNFIEPIARSYRDQSELVALCDLSRARMAHYNALLGGELGYHAVETFVPEQFEVMLRDKKVDCVIVTSKDSTHHDFIVRALRNRCDVVTEKPMTIDAEKCQLILDTVAETGKRLLVAFNYRWSPYRTKVKELVLSGVIGRVMSANVEYLLNTSHGADYYRRWHANMADSGGLLVHKSTHHFDLVNWWLDAIPEQVFSYGRLDFYGRRNALARGDGALTRYERYTGATDAAKDPFAIDLRESAMMEGLYSKAEAESGYVRDRNVFRDDIDIFDNMTALVRYRTGALVNYSLLSYSPREGMRVALNGDRGRLEYAESQATHILDNAGHSIGENFPAGDKASEFIRVYPHFKASYEVPVDQIEGGHGGSDPLLTKYIFSAGPSADPFSRVAGHEQGAASILVGIAANKSIATNKPVNIADLVRLRPDAKRLSELA